jgi:hypothetical protein
MVGKGEGVDEGEKKQGEKDEKGNSSCFYLSITRVLYFLCPIVHTHARTR